jgi:hypothetical protein
MQQPIAESANNGNLIQKLAIGGAMFGGTLLASKHYENALPLPHVMDIQPWS